MASLSRIPTQEALWSDPYALDQASPTNAPTLTLDSDFQRQKKLAGLGSLGSLFANSGTDNSDLQQQPLYGGDTTKSAAESAEEPSQIDVQRIQRAPQTQEATPLLSPEQRAGNILTGEEGSYGPLSGQQREVSLKQFFRP